ncbi:hypothetical protein QFC22_000048 [Naganishia vaughanmartiniae]|uniref:Uncharacterized protein n=1 Tax=Naganishia vaughanmartiniae TaxID=1424756 RepID=A0ACC2XM07_9TREE|nr:hypothetical protein QFC22_000048 [Naganishia vaughanmartiniae]
MEYEKSRATIPADKQDLNRIVLDYLIIEGYCDAATEFAKEAGIDISVDYQSIEERMLIRQAVEAGRVDEAVRRVNELEPEILDTNASLLFHLQLQSFIELIRHDKTQEALRYASEELAPRGAQNPEFLAELEKTMALLAFPELASFDRLQGESEDLNEYAEPLASAVASAPPTAKPPPAWSTLGSLMRKEHRTTVAKELNAAILESQGQGQETKLSGLVKLMSWTEEALENKGLPVPGVSASALLTLQGPPRHVLSGPSVTVPAAEPMVIN